MITKELTIDHEHPNAQRQYADAYKGWTDDCCRSLLSPKELRGSKRVRIRAIKRKQCEIQKDEIGNQLRRTFIAKGKVIGRLQVTFKNFKPDKHA